MGNFQPGIRWIGTPQTTFPPVKPPYIKMAAVMLTAVIIASVIPSMLGWGQDPSKPSAPAPPVPIATPKPTDDSIELEYAKENQKLRKKLGLTGERSNRPYVLLKTSTEDTKNWRDPHTTLLTTITEVTKANYSVVQKAVTQHKKITQQQKKQDNLRTITDHIYLPPLDKSDGSEKLNIVSLDQRDDEEATLRLLDAVYGQKDGKLHNPAEAHAIDAASLRTSTPPVDDESDIGSGFVSFFSCLFFFGLTFWLGKKFLPRFLQIKG